MPATLIAADVSASNAMAVVVLIRVTVGASLTGVMVRLTVTVLDVTPLLSSMV